MMRVLVQRIAWSVFVLWLVGTATFFGSLRLGDPVATLAGPHASARDRAYIRRFYQLDRPVLVQYGSYLAHLAQGDLGRSFRYHRPVVDILEERAPRTLLLGTLALAIEFVVGVALGVWAAARRGTRREAAMLGMTFVGISMPTFLSGFLLLSVFAFRLGWFPIGGYGVTFVEHLWHGLLPAIALALIGTASLARLTRAEVIDVLASDYVRTARAKGLSEGAVVVRHALRNALMPVVTSLGMAFGALFSGAIVTEHIFAWPGLGRLALESITGFDVPVIMGTVLLASVGIVLGNALSDVAYGLLDPRIRRP